MTRVLKEEDVRKFLGVIADGPFEGRTVIAVSVITVDSEKMNEGQLGDATTDFFHPQIINAESAAMLMVLGITENIEAGVSSNPTILDLRDERPL